MIKTFVNIHDKRWDAHKLDFAHIVMISLSGTETKTAKVIKDSDKTVEPWMRVSLGLRSFGDLNREVSIVLTDDAEIHALNKKYRKINQPTNVLSFETEDDELLGDIFISYDTVSREAKEQGKTFSEHATHMVVHGILHLIGHDHIDDNDANVMESLEIEILKRLGINNPYIYKDKKNKNRNSVINMAKFRENKNFGWFMRFVPVWMILAGCLASFGFAPHYIGLAAIVGFIALYLFTYNRNGFWRGFIPGFWFGVGYGTSMFYWVLNSIFVDPIIAEQMRVWFIPGLVGIAIGSGIVFGLPAAMTAAMRIQSWRRVILFATFWTFVLWLREWVFTGFPWNPIANMTMLFPLTANSMSVWGALGLSFVVLGLFFSIAHFLTEILDETRQKKYWYIPFAIFSFLVVIGMFLGHMNIKKAEDKTNVSPVIRLVQPGIAQSAKMSMQAAIDNVNHLIKLSAIQSTTSPDIIIWPETSYPFMVTGNEFPPSKEIGKTVISGTMSYKSGKVYNSMILADTDGNIINIYDKFHLVPFGEYQPFGKLIPSIGQLEFGGGPEIIRLDMPNNMTFHFAPSICYEIIFSGILLPDGATPDFIINVTNDTWFGASQGPHQHLDMARRYAIESGLPIARANYSGISAFILSDGTILSRLEIGDVGVIDGTIWGAHVTPYRIIGKNWIMVIILLFAAGIVIPKHARPTKD